MPSRHRLRLLVSASALAAVLLAGLLPTHASPRPKTYVALGDSYTAGPLIPLQEQPWGCLKSTNNYPKLLARTLGLALRDASCSGAQTKDMASAQGVSPEPNPPQFDRLDARVDLVTLQIGGNDIGFSGIAEACVRATVEQASCRDRFVHDGRDELRERVAATAPKIAAVLQEIHARSPRAEVYVLGYPGIFRLAGPASCPAMGVREDDALYLRGVQEALNAMIAEQAVIGGANYVDVYGPSAGKTACDLPVLRWVEPTVPLHAAAPIHPNLNGMVGMAEVVRQSVAPDVGSSRSGRPGERGKDPLIVRIQSTPSAA